MAPTRLAGRYELQEQLGEGGMGVVWRAIDTKTGASVAIKVIRDVSDAHAVELFAKEWRALAEMSHPNIVEVRDVDVIEENKHKKPFFVMPLLQGSTLSELISGASPQLTVGRVVEIASQVCKGLQAAHQCGLVHRDLKPSNIFVMDDFTAKIIDFGVVYLAGAKSTTGQKGTWQYMSPEQAQLKEITPASDIFSLGVVLYEAFTLRKPFARATVEETMQAVCKFVPPPVSEINPSVNDQIGKVVHKCLAKHPMHRFASARELSETLNKAFRNEVIFDPAKILPRIDRAKSAFRAGDEQFASEILAEMEAEGHLDPQITVLRMQIELAVKGKKVRHLLESARARMEQEEIPLALEKVREVLELDPGNADAMALRASMEKQRNETQIAKWLDLAQTHLGNHDFAAARHAVQEVLAIRSGEPRALDMIEKIESIEEDSRRIRGQKEQLYNSALKAYQNDEIDTALSKLERLFAVGRSNPNAAVPERDAVYQSFYKEVRSERDDIHSAIEEAQRQFGEQNFAEALRICKDGLAKHPSNGAFHALKIQVEDAERQHLSAYIAEVSRRVESEFDLDRRANILKEAAERFPNETQFAQQLKVIRERRDLVNSIVAKARQYEERGQYSEALSQWDILRNIHPQYPGLAFDLEQCKKERNRQVREEERARAVDEIQRLLESRSFAKAADSAKLAQDEFAGDEEIVGLRRVAEQGLERLQESRRLLEEGQRALVENDLERAAELLRSGLKLDPRSSALRDGLVNVLTERARLLLETDWQQAEPFYEEVQSLDPSHPGVRALRSTMSETKRQAVVARCLAEARALAAASDVTGALNLVRKARADYPNDPRLEQYEASLLRDSKELRDAEAGRRERIALEERQRACPTEAGSRPLEEKPPGIRSNISNAEFERTASEIGSATPAGKVVQVADPGQLAATKVFEPEEANREESGIPFPSLEGIRRFAYPNGKAAWGKLAAIGGVVLAVIALALFATRRPNKDAVAEQTAPTQIHLVTDPADATLTADSKPVTGGAISIPAGATVMIEVSRLGYKTKSIPLSADPGGTIKLDAEPLHLSVQTAESEGIVDLDGSKISDLSNGSMENYDLPPDGALHKLSAVTQGRTLFTVEFQAIPGSSPHLSPLREGDFFAVASLGGNATIYGAKSLKNMRLGDESIAEVPASGAVLPPLTNLNHELKYGSAGAEGTLSIEMGSAPSLVVHSVNPEQQVLITSNIETGTLTVDGQPVRQLQHAWRVSRAPGVHRFILTADGYATQSWSMTFQPHQTIKKNVVLTALAKTPQTPQNSSLVIASGTPGSEVLVDGRKIGELDASGNGRFAAIVSNGHHALTLQKSGYESRKLDLAADPPAEARLNGDDVRLAQWGTLAFNSLTKNLPVKYRRAGETFQSANSPSQVSLAPGKYEILVDAPGFAPYRTETTIKSGQLTTVTLNAAAPTPVISDPSQVTMEGEWFKLKDTGKFVYLKPGALNVNLVFSKPKSGIFWHSKIQWVIESADGLAEMQYELEEQKLTRKLLVDKKSADQKNSKVDAVSASQKVYLSVHVRIDATRVTVSNDKGEVLDDYTAAGHDLSNGRIGVKTNALFAVWGNRPASVN